jgi:multidrug efflux pump subunit AcrA (membrane-fusion protein)
MQHIVFFIQKLFRGRRVTAILIVLCVLIVVGIWKALTSAVQSPRYQTTQATKGTLIVSTVASGQVSTANSASVTTTISGVVNKTYAKNGQVVKAGDTIATIDLDLTSKQKYTQALASYQSARNAVESAKAQQLSLQATMFGKWDTYKTLAESDLYKDENSANRNLPEFHIPQKEWLAAESQYKTQQHVVTQTQSSLSNAWQQLQQSSPTLVAPISGVVQGLSLQPGAVLASTTSDTTQKIATIQTLAFPTVSVNLSEIDIAKLQLGQKATVTVDALTDKTFTGKEFWHRCIQLNHYRIHGNP